MANLREAELPAVEPLDAPPPLDVPILPEVKGWSVPRSWQLFPGETPEQALSVYLAMEQKRPALPRSVSATAGLPSNARDRSGSQ